MTFSRPGFGSASIQPGTNRGSAPTISLPKNTTVTDNAKLRLDGNAPTTAYNNEIRRGQEIQNFLNFFTDDDKGLIKFGQDEIVRAADREVSAAVEQYGPDFLSSSNATEEMRDAYANMSPRAKEKVVERQGFTAAASYGPMLQAAMADPAIQGALTKPGNDPETVEARSLAQSQAQQKALDAAGFPNGYQQLQFSKALGEANGKVTSEYYKKRMDRAANAQQQQLQETGVNVFDTTFNKAEDEMGSDDTGGEIPQVAVMAALQEILPDAAGYSVEKAAEIVATSILGGIMEGADDEKKYSRIAAVQKFLGLREINLPGGEENLADIPINNKAYGGQTLKQFLDKAEKTYRGSVEESKYARAALRVDNLFLNNPTGEAFKQALEFADTVDLSPKKRLALRDFVHRRANMVDQVQRENDRDVLLEIEDTGLTRELVDRIQDGNYSENLKDEVIRNVNNPEWTDPNIRAATRAMQDEIVAVEVDAGFGDLDGEEGGQGYVSYVSEADRKMMLAAREDGKPGIYEQRLRATYEKEVRLRAAEMLEQDRSEGTGELSGIDAVSQAIQQVNKERQKEYGPRQVVSPKDRFLSYAGKLREEMRISVENNGQLVINEDMVQSGKMKKWNGNQEGDFNSLSENKKRDVLIKGIQRLEKIDPETGRPVKYTEEEAVELFDELKKQAEEGAAPGQPGQSGGGAKGFTFRTPSVFAGQTERQQRYKQEQQQMKLPVDDDAAPVPPLMRRTLETLEKVTPWLQDKLTVPAEQQKGDPPALKQLKQWYNNNGNGGGRSSTDVVGAFLGFISGASSASAGELENASPDSLAAIRTSWQQGTQGLETAPLPQVAAATPTRYVPSAIATDKHETFVMIGVAEGTRTAGGGYTKAYYGHRDSADGNNNRGTVSGGRGNRLSPRQVDQKWMRILTSRSQQATPVLRAAGLEPGTAGWNRVMFNVLDLSVQSPAAVPDFLAKLGQVRRQRFTVEAIAKARADSFFSPNSGRLDAPGFGNSYQRLFKDQRQRAGVFDFRRRL